MQGLVGCLCYLNYSSLLLMRCVSERNKVGNTLLYEATVLKCNFLCLCCLFLRGVPPHCSVFPAYPFGTLHLDLSVRPVLPSCFSSGATRSARKEKFSLPVS